MEELGGNRKETSVAALGLTAQVALRSLLHSLSLPDISTDTFLKGVEEFGGKKDTYATASTKNDENKSGYGVSWAAAKGFAERVRSKKESMTIWGFEALGGREKMSAAKLDKDGIGKSRSSA